MTTYSPTEALEAADVAADEATKAGEVAARAIREANARAGAVIRSARLAAGLGQTQVADEVGIGKSYLSHIEHGRRPMSDQLRRQLLDTIGVGDINHGKPVLIHVEIDGQAFDVVLHAASLSDALLGAAALATDAWTASA